MKLKEKIASQIPEMRERVHSLVKEHGDVKVGDINVKQIYGGMRGVKALVSDISFVDPFHGIRLRGHTIPELLELLPKWNESDEMPMVGGMYYLLLTGEIPTQEEAHEVEHEWKARGKVPQYVYDLIKAMPKNASPMTLFAQAILSMQVESVFAKKYDEGLKKEDYWEAMLEDALNLTAKLPTIAAYIYNLKHNNGQMPEPDMNLCWSSNFAHLMGVEKPEYEDLARLYFIIHSDHESGNVSAHTTHLVGSALSDIYYAASAGMDGLAGPLHGRANQKSLAWLMKVYDKYNGVPTKEELTKFAWDTLNSGQVIPGYGHAVLRRTDPRFTVQYEFGNKHFKNDDLFELAKLVYEVVPPILKEQGKAKNPWANVDAISGTIQHHYGVKDTDEMGVGGFYTVLFGVSRILGVSANVVWDRAVGQPIERPKSLTTAMLEEIVAKP